jgi:hypothetical protein
LDQQGSDKSQHSEALGALQHFLSDSIPPMIFAESVEDVFNLPVRNTAGAILAWVAGQSQVGGAVTTSDYLFHAVKKLNLLGELELVPRDRLNTFIKSLSHFLLESCPEHERRTLATNLENLERSEGVVAAQVPVSAQPSGVLHVGGPAPGMATQPGAGQPGVFGDPLLGLMLQRLQSGIGGGQQLSGPRLAQSPLLAGVLAEAATLASSPTEFESTLGQLRNYGVPAEEGIVRILGQSLPDWAAPTTDDPEQEPPQRAVRAMKQIIALASDRQEKYERFAELVNTAVEEFNSGSLGRAVTMLDLADSMIEDDEVDPTIVDTVRGKGYSALDEQQLRQCAESEDLHYLFRRVMGFFPQLSPEELFLDLETEDSRDRRRLLLQLLTAQGGDAREAALDMLHKANAGEISLPWYLERNLVYLLRTIERPEDAPVGPEIGALIHESELDKPLPLIREAMATLGQMDNDRVVKTLVARVSELEDALLGGRQLPHTEEELQSLLDTALTMLVRTGTPEARRCLVAHGLKRQSELGNTLARLTKLGNQDLSGDAALVKRLVRAIKEELPTKVLGVSVGGRRKADNVERIIEALSGTDTPLVRQAFQELSTRYEGQPLGEAATRALQKLGAPPPSKETTTAALAGDLGLFGLPSLLQNLSDTQVTGVLTVLDAAGNTAATIRLDDGMVLSARTDRLEGEAAVYQMLEKPVLGRFIFVDSDEESEINMEKGAPKAVQPILFEGIRRYDEFMRAASLAPDDSQFKATDQKPTKVTDEPSMDLLKGVWFKAAKGATPAQCEAEFPVDCYRIRRMFEHWLGEGSLVTIEPGGGAPAGAQQPSSSSQTPAQ